MSQHHVQASNAVLKSSAVPSRKRGMTLIGFLFVLAAALFVAYIGMKLVPIYLNDYSLGSVFKSMAEVPDVRNMSESRIRDLLARKFETNYINYVRPRDIQIVRSGGLKLVANYEVRESLIGNIDVVVKFRREQEL
ncbi:MAG: DUF4845 domain-containing protein [Wenzhouxiangellaceae bacterium]